MVQHNAPARTPRVLLVDDSATTHMWIKMVLGKASFDLVSARDGEEGVRAALAGRPDVILMDVVMPRMNGFEATQELRKHAATRNTPIIMVTTRSEARNVEAGFAAGCSDYITKPIDAVELMAKLHAVLPASLAPAAPRSAAAG